MKSGFNGVDFEDNINFDRMRKARLARAKKYLKESGLGALLCLSLIHI